MENTDGNIYELEGAYSFYDRGNQVITIKTKDGQSISVKPSTIDLSSAPGNVNDSESIFRWVSGEYIKKKDLKSFYLRITCSEADGFSKAPPTGNTVFFLSTTSDGGYEIKSDKTINIHGYRVFGRDVFLDTGAQISLLRNGQFSLGFIDKNRLSYKADTLNVVSGIPWGSESLNGDFSCQTSPQVEWPRLHYPQDMGEWVTFNQPLIDVGEIKIITVLEFDADPQGNNAFTFEVEVAYTEG